MTSKVGEDISALDGMKEMFCIEVKDKQREFIFSLQVSLKLVFPCTKYVVLVSSDKQSSFCFSLFRNPWKNIQYEIGEGHGLLIKNW